MLSVLCLSHSDDVTTFLSQVLAHEYLTVADPDQVEEAAQLTAQERVFTNLKHAEDMFPQFYFECHEVVYRVQAQQVSISTPDEDMLLNLLRQEVTRRDRTPDRLIFHWLNLVLLSQRVQVKHIDLLVRPVDKKQLVASVLHIQFRNC